MFTQHRPIRIAGLTTRIAASILFLSFGGQLPAADQYPAKKSEAELITILQTKTKPEQAIACKQLAIYGSKSAVPELAKLLRDKELSSWARIPLEAIPDPSADAVLIDAAKELRGNLRIGVINSIGVRRSTGAVEVLSELIHNRNRGVGSASAVALGKIGTAEAIQALRAALTTTEGPVLSGVAEGCELSAERLAAAGKTDEAAKLYDAVRKADVPKPRKLEATRGAILARGNAGIPLLVEQLHSPDRSFFNIALTTSRQMPGREVSEALAAELPKVEPERAVALLAAFSDRHDAALPHTVLDAAKSKNEPLRIAAVEVIGRVGDAGSVPTLLEIAADSDASFSQAAAAALAALPGENVDAELRKNLEKVDGKSLVALIRAIGQRRIDASPELIKLLDNSDASIRQAALTALGETVKPKDLNVLVSRYVESKNPADSKVAHDALRAAAVRMSDRDRCASELAAALPSAPAEVQASLIGILADVGGAKALDTLGAASRGNDKQLQDAATRALGRWMTVDAAPVLLSLASSDSGCQFQSRALRGYIRLARQFVMTDSERAKICENGLAAAKTDSDRKLVLEALERHPSLEGLKLTVKATEFPGLAENARSSALVIAQKLGANRSEIRKLLAECGVKPVKLEIVKAEYGAGANMRDVTDVLRKGVGEFALVSLRARSYNKNFGGDPSPGSNKSLVVHYRIDGKPGQASFPEDAAIVLPMPK